MKVGLIGAGRIGAFHAKTLATSSRVAKLRITDVAQSRADELASEVGAEVASSSEDLVRWADAIVIATATDTHAEMIRMGAEAKIPTFCEKPISLDLETTDRVLEATDKAGIPLQIGFQRRFDPGFVESRRLVVSGELGTLYSARLATHDPAPPPDSYVKASGGLYRDLAIHDFDIIRWTTNSEVEEVFATGAVLTGNDAFTQADDIDTGVAILRMKNGALAIFSGLRHNPRGYDVRLELFGSRDSVVTGMNERSPLRLLDERTDSTGQTEYTDFMDRFGSAYRDELDAFLSLANGEIENPCPGTDARESLRVSLAAIKSLRERRFVALEEIR